MVTNAELDWAHKCSGHAELNLFWVKEDLRKKLDSIKIHALESLIKDHKGNITLCVQDIDNLISHLPFIEEFLESVKTQFDTKVHNLESELKNKKT